MKAVEGAALIAGAVVGEVVQPELSALWLKVGLLGASMVVEGIAQDLEGSQGNFSIRQAASPAQAIYGFTRTGGTIVWASTTGSNKDYLHLIIVWAMHPCASIESLWIDGKQVFFDGKGTGGDTLSGDNAVLNMLGQPTAGNATGGNHQDINGNQYNWDGSVCCYNHLGGDASVNPFLPFLGPNDPSYPTTAYFNGLTASYIKLTYNSNRFNGGIPQIRASIRGKSDIYDPRNQTTGYSANMALCVANMLCDKQIGVGCNYTAEIDETQLIAAANACDEQVSLAAGGTESRYECNGSFECNSSPGDIIQSMLDSCAGRLTYTGGRYGIFPGVWLGVTTAAIVPSNVIAAPTYTPTRKYRDLVNLCTGTFICPTYPWASGYSYDYQDPVMQVFNGCFQPTNFPYWSNDTFHGYLASQSYITDDQGRTLTKDIKLQFVLSAACAQRIAKITVMRNRFQASATFKCNLSLWNTTALDNIAVTFPYFELNNATFEVRQFQFDVTTDAGKPEDPPALATELTLQQTDPSIYDWSTSEELGLTVTQSPTVNDAFQVAPPTNLVLTSGQGTAYVNDAGIVMGRIGASWTSPADTFIVNSGSIEVQFSPAGANRWVSSGYMSGSTTSTVLGPCIGGNEYDVRVRGIRAGGVTSAWVQIDSYKVSTLATTIDSADIYYPDGASIASLQPAEPGADVTANGGVILIQNPNFAQGANGWSLPSGASIVASGSGSGYVEVLALTNTDGNASYNKAACYLPSCNPGGVDAPAAQSYVISAVSSPAPAGDPNMVTGSVTTNPTSTQTNVLWAKNYGANDDVTKLVHEWWFNVGATLGNAYEFDMQVFDRTRGLALVWGLQVLANGQWQTGTFSGPWQNLPASVPRLNLAPGTWHHIIHTGHRVIGDTSGPGGVPNTYHDSLYVDGTTYPLSVAMQSYPLPSGWNGLLGDQNQIDVAATSGTAKTVTCQYTGNNFTAYTGAEAAASGSVGNLVSYSFDNGNTAGLTATGTPAIDATKSFTPPNSVTFPSGINFYQTSAFAGQNAIYTRQYIYIDTLGSTGTTFLAYWAGGAEIATVFFNPSGSISWYNNQTATGAAVTTTNLSTGAWHLVETYFAIGASAGALTVKIDGAQVYSGANQNLGTAPVTSIQFGQCSGGTGWVTNQDNVDVSSTGWLGAATATQTQTQTSVGNLVSYNFDNGSTAGLTPTGAPAIDATKSFTRPNSVSFPAGVNFYQTSAFAGQNAIYTRQYIYIETLGSTGATFLAYWASGAELATVFFNPSGSISWYNNQTAAGAAVTTTNLSTGAWHLIETYFAIGATSGTLTVKVDGAQVYSGANQNLGTALITSIQFGQCSGGTGWVTNQDNVDVSSTGWLGAATAVVSQGVPGSAISGSGNVLSIDASVQAQNLQQIPCPAGAIISASAYASATGSTNGSAHIVVTCYDNAGNVTLANISNAISVVNGEWYQMRVASLPAPAGTIYAVVSAAVEGITSGAWYFSGFAASILPNSLDDVPNGSNWVKTSGTYVDPQTGAVIGFEGQGALATVDSVGDGQLTGGGVYGVGGSSAGPTVTASATTQDLPLNHLWNAQFQGTAGIQVGANGDGQPSPATINTALGGNEYSVWEVWSNPQDNSYATAFDGAGNIVLIPGPSGSVGAGVLQSVYAPMVGYDCPFTFSVQVAWQNTIQPNGDFELMVYAQLADSSEVEVASASFPATAFSSTEMRIAVLSGTLPQQAGSPAQTIDNWIFIIAGTQTTGAFVITRPMVSPAASISAYTSTYASAPEAAAPPSTTYPAPVATRPTAGSPVPGEAYGG